MLILQGYYVFRNEVRVEEIELKNRNLVILENKTIILEDHNLRYSLERVMFDGRLKISRCLCNYKLPDNTIFVLVKIYKKEPLASCYLPSPLSLLYGLVLYHLQSCFGKGQY